MIRSKEDYLSFLAQDQRALNRPDMGWKQRIYEILYPDYIWRFQKLLRGVEYWGNCKSTFCGRLIYHLVKFRFTRLSVRLGFSIPENVFGPGLAIVHYGTIVVNGKAKIGKNCRIHTCVNIGASGGSDKAPQIGDNVYIGPGSILFGDIHLADNIAISAHSLVNKSFTESNILIGGSPAQRIKSFDITKIIQHVQNDLC